MRSLRRQAGRSTTDRSSDVDVMIHGQISYHPAGRTLGSQMVRAELNIRLTNIEDGKTLGAFAERVKAGRSQMHASVQLAVSKLCDQTVPKLVDRIQNAFGK